MRQHHNQPPVNNTFNIIPYQHEWMREIVSNLHYPLIKEIEYRWNELKFTNRSDDHIKYRWKEIEFENLMIYYLSTQGK